MLQVSIQVLPSTPAGQLKLQGSRWTLVKAQHRLPFQQRPSLGDLGIGGRVWVWGTQSQDSGQKFQESLCFVIPSSFGICFLDEGYIYIVIYDIWLDFKTTNEANTDTLSVKQFSFWSFVWPVCQHGRLEYLPFWSFEVKVNRWSGPCGRCLYFLILTTATTDNHAKKTAAQLILLIILLVCRSMSSDDFLCISTVSIVRMWSWWLLSGKGVNSAKDGCFVLLDRWEKKLQVGKDMVLKGKAGKERKDLIWY